MSKDLEDALKKSRGVANLAKGSRVRLKNIEIVCDVVAKQEDGDDFYRLFLQPVKCGGDCPDKCECAYSLVKDPKSPDSNGKPLEYRVRASKRLDIVGNKDAIKLLERLLQEQKSSCPDWNNGIGKHNAEQQEETA